MLIYTSHLRLLPFSWMLSPAKLLRLSKNSTFSMLFLFPFCKHGINPCGEVLRNIFNHLVDMGIAQRLRKKIMRVISRLLTDKLMRRAEKARLTLFLVIVGKIKFRTIPPLFRSSSPGLHRRIPGGWAGRAWCASRPAADTGIPPRHWRGCHESAPGSRSARL
jgi:hypothetical protein